MKLFQLNYIIRLHQSNYALILGISFALVGAAALADGSGGGDSDADGRTELREIPLQGPKESKAVANELRSRLEVIQKELDDLLALPGQRSDDVIRRIVDLSESVMNAKQAIKLAEGDTRSVSRGALEAYSNARNPFFLMCGDEFWAPRDPNRWYEDKIQKLAPILTKIGRSVGLIISGSDPKGTGFIVGSHYLLTNRHVLERIAHEVGSGRWALNAETTVVFDREEITRDGKHCNDPKTHIVTAVFAMPNGNEDLGLLLVSSTSTSGGALPPPLSVSVRPLHKFNGNMTIGVIGYPGPPEDMLPSEQEANFRTPTHSAPQFQLKRFSEGYTAAVPVKGGMFSHLANTTDGNSGSPVVDLADGTVVGVHARGHNRFFDVLGYNCGVVGERVVSFLAQSRVVPHPTGAAVTSLESVKNRAPVPDCYQP